MEPQFPFFTWPRPRSLGRRVIKVSLGRNCGVYRIIVCGGNTLPPSKTERRVRARAKGIKKPQAHRGRKEKERERNKSQPSCSSCSRSLASRPVRAPTGRPRPLPGLRQVLQLGDERAGPRLRHAPHPAHLPLLPLQEVGLVAQKLPGPRHEEAPRRQEPGGEVRPGEVWQDHRGAMNISLVLQDSLEVLPRHSGFETYIRYK